MRTLTWRLLLASPLILLAVLFALSNTESVRVGLWPTDLLVEAPLSLVVLIAMAIAFLLGALTTWVVGLGARMRARRAEQSAEKLRAEIEALTARLARDREAATAVATILPPAR
jgi:uncharacterized integral membrane protein